MEMSEVQKVEQKFNNFKNYIRENSSSQNMLLVTFYQSPLELFLRTIYERNVKEKLSVSKTITLIFDKLELKKEDFTEDQLDTLTRYLTYFKEISKAMYS